MQGRPFSIDDLRARPDFADAVADRIWRAWWKPKGHALAPIEAFLETTLGPDVVPSAIVAHDAGLYLGSALVIASDLDARPGYTPWVAAVWVEAEHRGRGVGSALVQAGSALVKKGGFDRAHLCAMPHNHAFYQRLGWALVEPDVDGEGLAVFAFP